MNVAIAYSTQSYCKPQFGGLVQELVNGFKKYGDSVLILRYPHNLNCTDRDHQELSLAYSLMKLDNTSLLISLNSPICYLNHSKHIVWFMEKPKYMSSHLLNRARMVSAVNEVIFNEIKCAGLLTQTNLENEPQNKKEWDMLINKFRSI